MSCKSLEDFLAWSIMVTGLFHGLYFTKSGGSLTLKYFAYPLRWESAHRPGDSLAFSTNQDSQAPPTGNGLKVRFGMTIMLCRRMTR